MSEPRNTARSRVTIYTMAIAVVIWGVGWACAGEVPELAGGSLAMLAIVWLLVLMLWGVFSPPFKPYPEDPRLPPGSGT